MQRTLSILSVVMILGACGRAQQNFDSDNGSGLASIAVAPPQGMKFGVDFDKIEVKYQRVGTDKGWSGQKAFGSDQLSDPSFRLEEGRYRFGVFVSLKGVTKAESKSKDSNCLHQEKVVEAGKVNELKFQLCNYGLDNPDDDKPEDTHVTTTDAHVSITTTIVDSSGKPVDPTAKVTTNARLQLERDQLPKATYCDDELGNRSLEIMLRASIQGGNSGQTCWLKATTNARKTSGQTADLLAKTATFEGVAKAATDFKINFETKELAGYERPTTVELAYKCGTDSQWIKISEPISITW